MLIATTAGATPRPLRWVGGVAKETGRTAHDFITWRYPLVNAAFIAEIGADLADARTTADAQRRSAVESSVWLYGPHPSFHRVALTDIGLSFALATMSHAATEQTNPGPIRLLAIAPQVIDVVGTAHAAYHNTTVGERRLSCYESYVHTHFGHYC
jgi:hypothetical protein